VAWTISPGSGVRGTRANSIHSTCPTTATRGIPGPYALSGAATNLAAVGARTAHVHHVIAIVLALLGLGAPDGRFVPATDRDGDRVVLPLTFPDGTRMEVAYPPELALAELGLVPYGSATLQGHSPHPDRADEVGRDFLIRYGAVDPRPGSLVFAFGHWRVEVYDYAAGDPAAMTDDERRSFSRSLSGRETDDGFLILEASPPLRLAEAGEHAGPTLELGPPSPPPWLSLTLHPCGRRAESTSPGFASWCLSEDVIVHATGDRRFIAAATALELRRPPRAPSRASGAGNRSRTPPPAARP
jgi:hypothetical protein